MFERWITILRSRFQGEHRASVSPIFLLLFAICSTVLPLRVSAQAANAGAISGQTINLQGYPAAGATVRVCPVTATGTPCFPLATLYSDSALTQPLPNPLTADAAGNYRSFIASGLYVLQITVPGQTISNYTYYASPGNSGGAGGGGVNPASIPRPLGYYALAGSTISPTVAAASSSTPGATYSNFLGPQGIVNSSWQISQRPRIDVTHPNFGTPSGCTNPADPGAAITAFSITGNIATITANNQYQVGASIWIQGLTTGTYLNNPGGTAYTVTTATPTQFTVNFSHANVGTTTDSGVAITDSTCAFKAAVSYITTAYGTMAIGPFPQLYIPAGHYIVSSAIRVSGTYDIGGDSKPSSIIEAISTNQNIFTIFNDGSNTPNISGYGIRGGIHDVTLFTNLNGTVGTSFSGYTGTMLEVNNVQQYYVHDVAFIGGGGRGMTFGQSVEEVRIQRVYFDAIRWPIVGLGQGAPGSANDVYVSGPGSTPTNYNFGSNAALGIDPGISSAWNPTTVALTSFSADGLGGLQWTGTCTPSPSCLTKGVLGTSSPLAVGNWFVLQNLPSPYNVMNGIFMQVTAVVSAVSGSNFTISSCPVGDTSSSICNTAIPAQAQYGGSHTGGSPNYGPDTKITYTCTSSAGCSTSLLTPTAGTTTSLTGSYFAPVIFPDNAQSAVFGGGATFDITGLRVDPTWNGVGYQTVAPGKMAMHSYYSEGISLHGEPKPNAGIVIGGYLPWTLTTASFSGSTTCSSVAPCTVPVLDTSWFFDYANDPSVTTDITSNFSDMSFCPFDYNATQSGVASAFVPGVNTNQCEIMRGAMAGDGAFHPYVRNESGSTAPANTTWPSGSKVGWTLLSNPFSAGNNSAILSNMHNASIVRGGTYFVDGCSDQMPMICASYIAGIDYDNTMLWPRGWPSGSYGQGVSVTIEDPMLNVGLLDGRSEEMGSNCVKITNPSNVTFRSSAPFQQLPEGPLATNGYFINAASGCAINVNYVANGTTVMAQGQVYDSGNQHTVAGTNNSSTLGSGTFNYDLAFVKNTFAGIGTSPIPAVTAVNGKQFSTAYDLFDMGGYNKVASITSWSISGTTVTFQATNTFAASDQVVITGLSAGSWMNNAVTNGTYYSVVSPTGSSFQINLSGIANIFPYYATSATESGTATYYHSGIRLNIQGGPGNTGTSECVTTDLWNGTNFNFSIFKACAGSTPGASGTFTTPVGVPVSFGDAMTVAGAAALNGGFTAAGVVAIGNLSNLAPNSNNFAAGTWAVILGSVTMTTGQTDPWGGTTATQFVVGGSTVQQVDGYVPNPIVNGTQYNVCAWAKGAVGGETILFQVSGANSSQTLTTSWNYYCAVVTGTTAFNTRQFSWQTSTAETFYLAGVSTTLATNPPGFLVTGSTQVTTPLTSIAYPFLVATLSANNGTTLPLADLCTGTASAGKYCDGAGAWTTLPSGYQVYNTSGTALTSPHSIFATGALTGGTLAVTLTGTSVYTSSSSYICNPQDTTTPANSVTIAYSSGSAFTLTGTGTDAVRYSCVGN